MDKRCAWRDSHISHKSYVNIQVDNLTKPFVNLNEKFYIQNF